MDAMIDSLLAHICYFCPYTPLCVIQFLAPGFLVGLTLLAVPIIVHLFNFRRYKKIFFTNVRFLQELKEETTRASRLRHLLILACRLLALSFIVLAFARPILPLSNTVPLSAGAPVCVYVDNTFSMDAVGREGTLLEVAVRKAGEIAKAYPPETQFQLLTADFEAYRQRLIGKDDFLDELGRIKLSSQSRTLDAVLKRQREAAGAGKRSRAYIISDFQQSATDIDAVTPDSLQSVCLVALPLQETPNLYVDSCWLSSPVVQVGRPASMDVRLKNSSSSDAENIPVRFLLNGQQRAVASASIPAGETVKLSFSFTVSNPGWQEGVLQITDHPVSFDDRYYFAFEVKQFLSVLALGNRPSSSLQALFGKDPFFAFSTANTGNIDYTALPKQDLIIVHSMDQLSSGLADELAKYLDAGGSVAVFPDSAAKLTEYNSFLSRCEADQLSVIAAGVQRVKEIDLQHPIFEEVFEGKLNADMRLDYPVAQKHFELNVSATSSRKNLMKLEGGTPLLAQYNPGKGNLYLSTVPLEPGFSNFSRHAFFVPVLYRMAVLSTRPLAFASVIGEETPVVLNMSAPAGDETFRLVSREQNTDIVPAVRVVSSGIAVSTPGQVRNAGHYQLMRGKERVASMAFNYNRRESDLRFFSEAELEEKIADKANSGWQLYTSSVPDLQKSLTLENKGRPLWKYAIIAALLFLFIEILLIRYWKKA